MVEVVAWKLDVLVFLACIGGLAIIIMTGIGGLLIFCWWADHIEKKPKKTLKQLKKQWEALPVERR